MIKITCPKNWGIGWGMDENCIPFKLVAGDWIEQSPIHKKNLNPRIIPESEVEVIIPKF